MFECTSVKGSTSFLFEICRNCLSLLLPVGVPRSTSCLKEDARSSCWTAPWLLCLQAFAWWTDLMVEHAENFLSLYAIDMDAALEIQSPESWDSFPLFQLLNDFLRLDCEFLRSHLWAFLLRNKFKKKKTPLTSFCFCFAQITCAMESSTNTFRIFMLLWWLDMWIWWSPPSHSQFTRDLSESPGSL